MSAILDPVFDRPIFIISPPRSGSTLLFETLMRAPGLYTVGGESHAVIEGFAPLSVPARNFHSNVLSAEDATPAICDGLRGRFLSQLRDRDGVRPRAAPVRLLEKTPKNALRIPFLARVFPAARFVYLHRDPHQVLSSMMEAWGSGRFRTYPMLPGWTGPPWSLLLTPSWQSLAGRPLAEIVTTQWRLAAEHLLDGLSDIPPERLYACRYDDFVGGWGSEVRRLCAALDLAWDQPLEGPLPNSRFTVSRPDPDKWRTKAAVIEPYWPLLAPVAARAERFAALYAKEVGPN